MGPDNNGPPSSPSNRSSRSDFTVGDGKTKPNGLSFEEFSSRLAGKSPKSKNGNSSAVDSVPTVTTSRGNKLVDRGRGLSVGLEEDGAVRRGERQSNKSFYQKTASNRSNNRSFGNASKSSYFGEGGIGNNEIAPESVPNLDVDEDEDFNAVEQRLDWGVTLDMSNSPKAGNTTARRPASASPAMRLSSGHR